MIIIYLRSSSATDLELCQHKYYINYCLGYHFEAGKAANLGTTLHKCMELLALRKVTEQNNGIVFTEPDTKQVLPVTITPNEALDFAYNLYKEKYNFVPKDKETVRTNLWDALLYRDGMFSPLKREIVHPEKYFDIEMPQEWARYSYKIGNETITGKLHIKGTSDLVTKVNHNTIEYIDWKSGKDDCWVTGDKKDYNKLRNDFQLRLYHYALHQEFPDFNKILTLFYTKKECQGPRTIYFDQYDIPETELIIKRYFEKAKSIIKPTLIYPSYKCNFCPFSKEKWKNTGKTYCEFFKNEIRRNGLDKTTEQYILRESMNSYQGGGKTIEG